MTASDATPLDPQRIAELYITLSDEVKAFLTGVLKDRELAAEVLQVTFTRVVEQGHTANPSTIRGWVFKVALREALVYKRKQKVRDNALPRLAEGVRESVTPLDVVCSGEQIEQVRQAITKLPDAQQDIVRMRIYEGETFARIAERLQLPLGTVLTRMRLAQKALYQELRSDDDPVMPD